MASHRNHLKAAMTRKAAQGVDTLTAELLRKARKLTRTLYGRDLTPAERQALVENKTLGEVLSETTQ